MHRVEHAGQEGQRHDQEILERRELVEFFRPDARDYAKAAKYGAAQHGEALPDDGGAAPATVTRDAGNRDEAREGACGYERPK